MLCLLGAMDCFARGLRNAVKIVEDGLFDKHVKVCLFASCQCSLAVKISLLSET